MAIFNCYVSSPNGTRRDRSCGPIATAAWCITRMTKGGGHLMNRSVRRKVSYHRSAKTKRIPSGYLMLFNIAMESGPFTDDFPCKTSIYHGFSMAMLNNPRVYTMFIHYIGSYNPEIWWRLCLWTTATAVSRSTYQPTNQPTRKSNASIKTIQNPQKIQWIRLWLPGASF